jgi:hypothetical protein
MILNACFYENGYFWQLWHLNRFIVFSDMSCQQTSKNNTQQLKEKTKVICYIYCEIDRMWNMYLHNKEKQHTTLLPAYIMSVEDKGIYGKIILLY